MEMKLTESNWTEVRTGQLNNNNFLHSGLHGSKWPQVSGAAQWPSELPKDKIKVINQLETYYPLTADN